MGNKGNQKASLMATLVTPQLVAAHAAADEGNKQFAGKAGSSIEREFVARCFGKRKHRRGWCSL